MTADEEKQLDKEVQAELARLRAELADALAGREANIRLRDEAEAREAATRKTLVENGRRHVAEQAAMRDEVETMRSQLQGAWRERDEIKAERDALKAGERP